MEMEWDVKSRRAILFVNEKSHENLPYIVPSFRKCAYLDVNDLLILNFILGLGNTKLPEYCAWLKLNGKKITDNKNPRKWEQHVLEYDVAKKIEGAPISQIWLSFLNQSTEVTEELFDLFDRLKVTKEEGLISIAFNCWKGLRTPIANPVMDKMIRKTRQL